jgi:hypothetical protein
VSVTILAPRAWTSRDLLRAQEWHPVTHARLPGGLVADLADTQKMIQLCPTCRPKFSARANRYERWRSSWVIGPCDACQAMSRHCEAFIPQALHELSGDWERVPRRGRWARYTSGAYAAFHSFRGWGSR